MIDCPELDCGFDDSEVTPPGSCCPVCGEYLLLHSDHSEVTATCVGCPNGNGTFLLPGETIMPDCNTWYACTYCDLILINF